MVTHLGLFHTLGPIIIYHEKGRRKEVRRFWLCHKKITPHPPLRPCSMLVAFHPLISSQQSVVNSQFSIAVLPPL